MGPAPAGWAAPLWAAALGAAEQPWKEEDASDKQLVDVDPASRGRMTVYSDGIGHRLPPSTLAPIPAFLPPEAGPDCGGRREDPGGGQRWGDRLAASGGHRKTVPGNSVAGQGAPGAGRQLWGEAGSETGGGSILQSWQQRIRVAERGGQGQLAWLPRRPRAGGRRRTRRRAVWASPDQKPQQQLLDAAD